MCDHRVIIPGVISACSGNRPYNFYFSVEIKIVPPVPRTGG